MLIVMPRSFSSGALSIESNDRKSPMPRMLHHLVIAAVRVVFPWSMCPIVPTFKCGFDRSNFCLAILFTLLAKVDHDVVGYGEPSMGFEPMTPFLPRMCSTV